MNSIYWVISRDCNQLCPHCYNDSGPGAPGLMPDEVDACIANLPDPDDVEVGRFILSGGEVLAWPALLFRAIGGLWRRFGSRSQIWVQTNGDLLDGPMLDRLLESGVERIDVSSMDTFHPRATVERRGDLSRLFGSRGLVPAEPEGDGPRSARRYAFWGATTEQWIGPLWPRGRARSKGLSTAAPEHEFCRMWSGAKGFLDYHTVDCEVNVQLCDVYPCCPMTCRPLGSLLAEPLLAILDRCAQHPVFQALNEGRPEAMGEVLGIEEAEGFRRSRELGNHCLWCDEFFTAHAPELLVRGARTERGRVDLDVDLSALRIRRQAPAEAPGWIATRPIDLGG